MTEKELRKLNRYQLLELLVMQGEQMEQMQKKIDELESRRMGREIRISTLGSVAEASMELSGVFEAAQQAADLYLENAKKQGDRIVRRAQAEAKEILQQADKELQYLTILKEQYKGDTQ